MSYGFKRMGRRCLPSLGCMRVIERGTRLDGVKFEDPRLQGAEAYKRNAGLSSKAALLRQGELARMA